MCCNGSRSTASLRFTQKVFPLAMHGSAAACCSQVQDQVCERMHVPAGLSEWVRFVLLKVGAGGSLLQALLQACLAVVDLATATCRNDYFFQCHEVDSDAPAAPSGGL